MKKLILLCIICILGVHLRSQNLILNPSFEQNEKPDCSGWYPVCDAPFHVTCDSTSGCGVMIIQESSPDTLSGKWCMQTYGNFPYPGAVITYVPARAGTFIYQLHFWMKTEHFVGEVYTGLVKNRVLHDPAFFSDFGHLWTSYTIFDTITTSGTDTIGVQLGSALGDFCICDVEYDQIELTIIDSLTTPITVPFQQHDILVSPNPFMDRITIQSAEGNEFTIFIFSSDGNLISSNKSYSDFTLLDLSSFSSGIYFYQLHWRDKNKFPVQGKLIKM